MKNKLIKVSFLVTLFFTVALSATAQVYVSIRPPVPVIVRPPQPTVTHVWVSEEWEPVGNSYRYSGGHWAAPPSPGYYRKPGHWKTNKQGQYWVPGGWGNNGNGQAKGHGKKHH